MAAAIAIEDVEMRNIEPVNENIPLLIAANSGHFPETVRNGTTEREGESIPPLYMAVLSGSLALVQESSQSELPEANSTVGAGPNGQTALHAAVLYNPRYLSEALQGDRHVIFQRHYSLECFFWRSSDYKIVQELLHWKPELARKVDNLGATPLHYAASIGNRKIAKLLLKHDSTLANIQDSSGSYPIHVAATMGRTGVIIELISQWPNSYELLDNQGRNFFHVAVERRKRRLISYFSQKSEMSKLMNAADFKGNTPLRLMVESGDKDFTALLERREGIMHSIMPWMFPPDWLHKYWNERGAIPSPYLLHDLRRDNQNSGNKLKGLKLKAKSFFLCTVLIATVTFNASLNVPGGYKGDGTPVLAENSVFIWFLAANNLAFAFSIVAVFMFSLAKIWTAVEHQQTRMEILGHQLNIWLSTVCMSVAAFLMFVAFLSGVFLLLGDYSFDQSAPVLVISCYALLQVIIWFRLFYISKISVEARLI